MQVQLCKIEGLEANPLIGAYENPACLDLTCTRIIKIEDGVIYLGTGWKAASPPKGYYLEIHPRSSMVKKGWMLANCTGIIDPDYRGELIVAIVPTMRMLNYALRILDGRDLMHVVGNLDYLHKALDLERYFKSTITLPEALVQICLRPYIPIAIQEVLSLISTQRDSGSFGSSNQSQ